MKPTGMLACAHPVTPESVARAVRHLPSAPKIVPRLWYLLNGAPQPPSLLEIGQLIRLDPGLTARVLQLGNHVSAEKGEACFTVEDAINVIGFNDVYALVSEVSALQIFVNPLSSYGLDAEEMWRLSLSCGLSAELLAEITGEDASVAYTIGLLHGIGMAAIDHWAQTEAPTLFFLPSGSGDYFATERATLGFTHADVGASMLRRWDFPQTMCEPIRCQEEPLDAAGHRRMTCLLHAAKWLCAVVCANEDDAPPAMPDPQFLAPLDLTAEHMHRLVVDVRVRLGAARNMVEAHRFA